MALSPSLSLYLYSCNVMKGEQTSLGKKNRMMVSRLLAQVANILGAETHGSRRSSIGVGVVTPVDIS